MAGFHEEPTKPCVASSPSLAEDEASGPPPPDQHGRTFSTVHVLVSPFQA